MARRDWKPMKRSSMPGWRGKLKNNMDLYSQMVAKMAVKMYSLHSDIHWKAMTKQERDRWKVYKDMTSDSRIGRNAEILPNVGKKELELVPRGASLKVMAWTSTTWMSSLHSRYSAAWLWTTALIGENAKPRIGGYCLKSILHQE